MKKEWFVYLIIWILAFIAFGTFAYKSDFTHMFIAVAFIWIGVLGMNQWDNN